MPDVMFISELIDSLEGSCNIDQARIHADGVSNGGGMAFAPSCTLSDRIAAVGWCRPRDRWNGAGVPTIDLCR
jgi:poly(3-hydroxybutyrate) depolymerase